MSTGAIIFSSLKSVSISIKGLKPRRGQNARHYFHRLGFDFLRPSARVRALLREGLRGEAMTIEYAISAVIAVGLLIYLLWALLKPERF